MSLQDEILKRINEEIANDPSGVGYAGKTDDEIMLLLNNPVVKQKSIEYTETAPISRILSGLSQAPNVVEVKDVKASKTIVSDAVIAGG